MEKREDLERFLSNLRELSSLTSWSKDEMYEALMAYAAAGWPFGLSRKGFPLWAKYDGGTRPN